MPFNKMEIRLPASKRQRKGPDFPTSVKNSGPDAFSRIKKLPYHSHDRILLIGLTFRMPRKMKAPTISTANSPAATSMTDSQNGRFSTIFSSSATMNPFAAAPMNGTVNKAQSAFFAARPTAHIPKTAMTVAVVPNATSMIPRGEKKLAITHPRMSPGINRISKKARKIRISETRN